MDEIDLEAFIRHQKSILTDYEKEYLILQKLQNDLEANKPVKWYNNTYYILKRVISVLLSIVFAILAIWLLFYDDYFRSLFDHYLSHFVQNLINDSRGMRIKINFEQNSAFLQTLGERNVNAEINASIVSDVYNVLRIFCVVLLIIGIFSLLYISRLTKLMYRKNKVIESYYESTVEFVDIYKSFIQNKKQEIKFLSNYAKRH